MALLGLGIAPRGLGAVQENALLGLGAVHLGLGERATRVRVRYGLDHIDYIVIYMHSIV